MNDRFELGIEQVQVVVRYLQDYISAVPDEQKSTLQRIYYDELVPHSYFVSDWDMNDIELIRKAGLGPLDTEIFAPFLRVKFFDRYLAQGVLTLPNRHMQSYHLYLSMLGMIVSKTEEYKEAKAKASKRANKDY